MYKNISKISITQIIMLICFWTYSNSIHAQASTEEKIYSLVATALPGEIRLNWLQDDLLTYTLTWQSCTPSQKRNSAAQECTGQQQSGQQHSISSPHFFGPFAANTEVKWWLTAYQENNSIQHSSGSELVQHSGLQLLSSYPTTNTVEWQSYEPITLEFTQVILLLDTGTIKITPLDVTKARFDYPHTNTFIIKANSSWIRINNNQLHIASPAFYKTGVHRTGINLLFDTEYQIILDRVVEGAVNQAAMHGYQLTTFRTPALKLFTPSTQEPNLEPFKVDADLDEESLKSLNLSRKKHGKSILQENNSSFSGLGVKVAFMDEGILQNHPVNDNVVWRLKQLNDQFLLPLDAFSRNNHGTLMAGFLLDYAPDAQLIDFHVFAGPAHTHIPLLNGFNRKQISPFAYAQLAKELQADILNVSLISRDFQNRPKDWATAIDNGLIVSKSLGNHRNHPNLWASAKCLDPTNLLPYFYDFSQASGAIVTLQAVVFDGNQYLSVRARADDAASYTLSVLETGKGATSQAAATFSGILATLIQAARFYNRPYTPKQIVELLFETAEDIGEAGVDPIFGYGLVNLPAALKRIENGHAPLFHLYSDLSIHHYISSFKCSS